MFNWITKYFVSNLDNLKNEEVWYYTCENDHKWKSLDSPRGNACMGFNLDGEECTKCPVCQSEICKGKVYINGKYTNMGAIHCDFIKRRKV